KVTQHISDTVTKNSGQLTVLVATHEHKDHLSGFNTAPDLFTAMKPQHVWLAWTENPNDELAQQIKIYKNDLNLALGVAVNAIHPAGAKDPKEPPPAVAAAMAARDVL